MSGRLLSRDSECVLMPIRLISSSAQIVECLYSLLLQPETRFILTAAGVSARQRHSWPVLLTTRSGVHKHQLHQCLCFLATSALWNMGLRSVLVERQAGHRRTCSRADHKRGKPRPCALAQHGLNSLDGNNVPSNFCPSAHHKTVIWILSAA